MRLNTHQKTAPQLRRRIAKVRPAPPIVRGSRRGAGRPQRICHCRCATRTAPLRLRQARRRRRALPHRCGRSGNAPRIRTVPSNGEARTFASTRDIGERTCFVICDVRVRPQAYFLYRGSARCRAQAEPTGRTLRQHCRSLGGGGGEGGPSAPNHMRAGSTRSRTAPRSETTQGPTVFGFVVHSALSNPKPE